MSRQVLVWSERSGAGRFTLYACLRPAGQSVAIGKRLADDGPYLGNVATSHVIISGTLVSDLLTTGLDGQSACLKYYPTDPMCMTARQTAQVFDLDTRRSLRQALAGAAVAYAFASTGAIAWEAPVSPGIANDPLMLQAVGFDPATLEEGPIETLDTGDLGVSLQFTGMTLDWYNVGQLKSQVLTNTS
jgi:hypothetical protein